MVLNKPSMTNIFEMPGNLVQFLCGHQSALEVEGVNSMGAITPRIFSLLALAHKVGAWLRSLLHVRWKHRVAINSRVLQNDKAFALVAYDFRA
jgi:hypothetical protein